MPDSIIISIAVLLAMYGAHRLQVKLRRQRETEKDALDLRKTFLLQTARRMFPTASGDAESLDLLYQHIFRDQLYSVRSMSWIEPNDLDIIQHLRREAINNTIQFESQFIINQ